MALFSPDFIMQTSLEDKDLPNQSIILPIPSPPTDQIQYLPPVKSFSHLTSLLDSESSGYLTSSTRLSDHRRSRFFPLDLYREERARSRNFTQSPIHRLSPDILGTVFEYICLSRPKKAWQRPFCPTVLGSICSYWRRVAWSTPRVWTHIRMDYSFWRAAGRNHMLKLYIQNSRGLGLHLEVRHEPAVDGREGSLGIPGGDVFDTLFLRYPHKLTSLEFRVYVNAWLFHMGGISKLGRLTNLTRLRVKDSRDLVPVPGTPFSLYEAPALRELVLDGLGGPLLCAWPQLTELTLAVIPSDDAFTAIQYCTNLKSLRCLHLIHQDIWHPDLLPDSITTFPFLEKVVWESTVPLSVSWNEALTHWFQFPSLRTLMFNMPITVVKQPSSFLLNLPQSVSSLSLQIDLRNLKEAQTCISRRLRSLKAANIDILYRVLCSAPQLSSLTLQCDPVFDPELIELLVSRGSVVTDLAPALRELVLVTDSPWSPEAFSTLLKVIDSRRLGVSWAVRELSAVGLVVSTAKSIERWPEAFINEMREQVQRGLQVAVNVKGEGRVDIDWFAPYQPPGMDEDYASTSTWSDEL
ncbi:hypothetical protein NP233_g244 [Leucocoprinus birnbaumii]|uniref:F-box domain-containing protein n=1 Tax=Leucocoprinus birnbaumii TaxID=56174 RepID=A0AAD5Z0E1_9AGAR|nr:hypothetical protein NP233_g244 [Leucocoprinus birnbaumii]